MRISKKAEYGLRALAAMARAPEAQLHQIHELSRQENIPVKFLEQILLALRHAGILTSRRGVRGGYQYARPPGRITVGEVIRLMDGPIAPVPCALAKPVEPCTCPDPDTCSVRAMMREVRADLDTMFDSRTIEDLVKMGRDAGLIEFQI